MVLVFLRVKYDERVKARLSLFSSCALWIVRPIDLCRSFCLGGSYCHIIPPQFIQCRQDLTYIIKFSTSMRSILGSSEGGALNLNADFNNYRSDLWLRQSYKFIWLCYLWDVWSYAWAWFSMHIMYNFYYTGYHPVLFPSSPEGFSRNPGVILHFYY